MATPKPTIVIIPGALHSPSHHAPLIAKLQEAGYPTECSRLPSVGPTDPSTVSVESDATFIREKVLLPLLDAGADVILFLHSFAGIPGSVAAKGLSKAERKEKGQKGGVIGIVMLAAMIAPEGGIVEVMSGGKLSPWLQVDEESGTASVPDPGPYFYSDVPPDLARPAIAALLPHALLSFRTPSPAPAWADRAFDGRRAYIRCRDDAAVEAATQALMVQYSGVEWDVAELPSGHSPQLTMPGKVVELVEGWAGSWV